MRNILLVGAGKSSSHLIQYFSRLAERENWQLTIEIFPPGWQQKKPPVMIA
jgi:hypothetical protein